MAGRTVSTRHITTIVAVPPNTSPAAPFSVNVPLGEVTWDHVKLLVPTGHSGLTGVRFEYAGEPIVPWGRPPTWIIADGFSEVFVVDFQVSGPVVVSAYNQDYFPHSFYCYFQVSDLVAANAGRSAAIVPVSPR